MSFDWAQFLKVAAFLETHSDVGLDDGALKRSAVSRAYYAAFCLARNYLRDNLGFNPSYTGEDHRDVVKRLRLEGRGLRKAGENLERLRQWRNQCDYDDVLHNMPNLLRGAMKCATEVLTTFEQPRV
jgi:hypothetical protein